MPRLIRVVPALVVALVVAACGAGTPVAPSAPAATATPAQTSPTAPPAPTPAPVATEFTSATYGYSLMLPPGWRSIPAESRWDGKGAPYSTDAENDRFLSDVTWSAWSVAAPTTKDLAGRVKEYIAAHAEIHGDQCGPVPVFQDPIAIDGESAILLGYDCGILINWAVAIHDGMSYHFGFRDPAIHAATYPADRDTFLMLLDSVRFPD
jgi:hypothetical protein